MLCPLCTVTANCSAQGPHTTIPKVSHMTGLWIGTSPGVPQCALKASHYCGQGPRRPTWASYYRGLKVAAAATNPGVQLIAVELRGVWLGPRGDNAPLCNHPNPTHPPSNPPTPLKSPPRKSWVAINQSTKYQCSATNKQNENTNQPTQIAARGHRVLGIVGLSV